MLKLLTSASIAALLAMGTASAQTTAPADKDTPSTSQSAPSTAPSTQPSTAPSTTMDRGAATGSDITLTEAQVKEWTGKPVYSSDNKNLGEVADIAMESGSQKVKELHADIGGFLGIGESRVRLMPAQFELRDDRVVLKMTADQAKSLPKVDASKK